MGFNPHWQVKMQWDIFWRKPNKKSQPSLKFFLHNLVCVVILWRRNLQSCPPENRWTSVQGQRRLIHMSKFANHIFRYSGIHEAAWDMMPIVMKQSVCTYLNSNEIGAPAIDMDRRWQEIFSSLEVFQNQVLTTFQNQTKL